MGNLSRSDYLNQRLLIFFDDFEVAEEWFDSHEVEVTIEDVKEIKGKIAIIYRDLEMM